ncbi:MAG: alpha/beta fold hydrolase [Candidatus Micrarchaeota archaeon]|nr:alpha/beta fold hydrolase [Candidatus Micrarchaeota archaeon]
MSAKRISFLVNKDRLNGTLFFPTKLRPSNPAVLFIHGWKSNELGYVKRAEPLVKLGYICLSFNLRGHGDSAGSIDTVTLADNLKDVISAYDFLASQKEVDKKAIHVVGTSYGGYLAQMLTSKRKIKSLVLRAPTIYKDHDLNKSKNSVSVVESWGDFKTKELSPQGNKALKALSKFYGKIFLIESGNDETVPHLIIESIIGASRQNRLEHKIVRGADHRMSKEIWQLRFRQLLADWFSRQK